MEALSVNSDGEIRMDPEIVRLSQKARSLLYEAMETMEEIDRARNKSEACKSVAARYGCARGYAPENLRCKYHRWVKAGRDWRTLVDKAKSPKPRKAVTAKSLMMPVFKKYCENNQRVTSRAWDLLMAHINLGKVFPGVGDWRDLWRLDNPGRALPEKCPKEWMPRGMSRRNLLHYASLTPFERTASRIGTRAASLYVPGVYSTRVGLLPGQIYQFDDVWHDVEVVAPGLSGVLSRPLEFACIDVASAYKVSYILRPRYEKEDGKRDGLKKREFLWHVFDVLCNYGYHRDGCVLVLEHGTAALTPEERSTLSRLSGGRITFRDSDILGKALHAGMFDGTGKGNPRAKALIESSHRWLHNAMAMLPAQTGGNSRIDRPEQLEGIEKYAESVMKAWATLPDILRARLRHPAPLWNEYGEFYRAINNQIQNRSNHDIEGWEGNDWLEAEYDMDGNGHWLSTRDIMTLPEHSRDGALFAAKTPGFTRMRKWSPREAWDSGRDNLIKLPFWGIVDFLGKDAMKRVTVRPNHTIEFEDREFGAGKHRFLGTVATPYGDSMGLIPGRDYGIYAMPCDMTKAVVIDMDNGETLGVAPAWKPVNPLDTVNVREVQELQGKIRVALSAPVIERHTDEADDRTAAMAHNELVVAEGQALAKGKPKNNLPKAPKGRDPLADLVTGTTIEKKGTVDDEW